LRANARYVGEGDGVGVGESVKVVVNELSARPGKQFVFARKIWNLVLFAKLPSEAVSKIGLAASGVSEGDGNGVGVDPAVDPGMGTGVARKPIDWVNAVLPNVEVA
jgi:hypothetical protein